MTAVPFDIVLQEPDEHGRTHGVLNIGPASIDIRNWRRTGPRVVEGEMDASFEALVMRLEGRVRV